LIFQRYANQIAIILFSRVYRDAQSALDIAAAINGYDVHSSLAEIVGIALNLPFCIRTHRRTMDRPPGFEHIIPGVQQLVKQGDVANC